MIILNWVSNDALGSRSWVQKPTETRRRLSQLLEALWLFARTLSRRTESIICAPTELASRVHFDCLWEIAFADGNLDRFEDHTIRKIADLIYVEHQEFMKSKIRMRDMVKRFE